MYIRHTNSTNDWIKEHADELTGSINYVRTDYQSAGRGQKGNSWQSEDGKNLLMSVLLRDLHIPIQNAFNLSMAVAIAIYNSIEEEVNGNCDVLSVKWPNDIYYGDKKICGTLIENEITAGEVTQSVAGIGLNVNQTDWDKALPNPVSLKDITHNDHDIDTIAEHICCNIKDMLAKDRQYLREAYMSHLYRRNGWHKYQAYSSDKQAEGLVRQPNNLVFEAQIEDIDMQGNLILKHKDGSLHTYHFKQVQYVL